MKDDKKDDEKTVLEKVDLAEKLDKINEHWRPRVVGALNGQEVKLVKIEGEFPWHHHENEDELFLPIRGSMTVEFRDHAVTLEPGQFLIVPRGVEHRTLAESECEVMLFEPAETLNTGNVKDEVFTAPTSHWI